MNFAHKIFLLMQDAFVKASSFVSPSIIHNTEKHSAIKKALFYTNIEGVKGDYLEFGVYEGTSIKGAASYWRKMSKKPMRFYGFDSFKGMRPEKGDEHEFYTSFDFSTDYKIIKKRFKDFPEVKLVPGFFQDTLKKSPKEYGMKKASVVMIDCDLHSSAKLSFNFLKPLVQKGTILILDDFFNYLGDKKKGVRAAFEEFVKAKNMEYVELGKYGIGGIILLITNLKE